MTSTRKKKWTIVVAIALVVLVFNILGPPSPTEQVIVLGGGVVLSLCVVLFPERTRGANAQKDATGAGAREFPRE